MMAPPPKNASTCGEAVGAKPTGENKARRKEEFLEQLFFGHSVTQASKMTGISRRALYAWRTKDETFRVLWDMATGGSSGDGADMVEREALRRAVLGVKKPVFRGGEQVATVTEHSDSLLMFLLKARQPEKYGGAKGTEADKPDFDLEGTRDALFSKFSALNAKPGSD